MPLRTTEAIPAARPGRPATKANQLAAAICSIQDAQAQLQELHFTGSAIVRADLAAARAILLDAALAEPVLPGTGQGGV